MGRVQAGGVMTPRETLELLEANIEHAHEKGTGEIQTSPEDHRAIRAVLAENERLHGQMYRSHPFYYDEWKKRGARIEAALAEFGKHNDPGDAANMMAKALRGEESSDG
jgi:hypothetical protein